MKSLYLTEAQQVRYWARALRAVTDFYLKGDRYHGQVKIVGGRILAVEVCGEELDTVRDITDVLLKEEYRPHSGTCGEIYMDVPESVLMAISRKGKPAGQGPSFINV